MSHKLAVLMGSPDDRGKMQPAADTLEGFDVECDLRVMSAHRSPEAVAEFSRYARAEGYSAVICGASMAAHLAEHRADQAARR